MKHAVLHKVLANFAIPLRNWLRNKITPSAKREWNNEIIQLQTRSFEDFNFNRALNEWKEPKDKKNILRICPLDKFKGAPLVSFEIPPVFMSKGKLPLSW